MISFNHLMLRSRSLGCMSAVPAAALIAVLGLLGPSSSTAQEGAESLEQAQLPATRVVDETRATVEFSHPEKFVDFRNYDRGRDNGQPAMMADLQLHIHQLAERYLPAGQRIHITFTNIDLAGRVLPIRGGGEFQRYVEDFYPPRLWFSYRLMDAQGQVLESGDESLVNFSFLRLASRSAAYRNNSLPYEKSLLDHWWRDHFGGAEPPDSEDKDRKD